MALSLDKLVFNDTKVVADIDFELDFVGYYTNWSSTEITDCVTSSQYSECLVNTYHLCAQEATMTTALLDLDNAAPAWSFWWPYSKCLFTKQYPPSDSPSAPYIECASPNPIAGRACTREEFPKVLSDASDACAAEAKLDQTVAKNIQTCVADGRGLRLLKGSFKKTVSFPKNPHGKIEPQWIEVDGPSCEKASWSGCKKAFDKTHCEDWDNCDSDNWALHIRDVVLQNTESS